MDTNFEQKEMEGTKREKKPLTLTLSQGERGYEAGRWVTLRLSLPNGGEREEVGATNHQSNRTCLFPPACETQAESRFAGRGRLRYGK
jgi:hypothetical protein